MKPTIQVCALDSSNFILNYSNFGPNQFVEIAEYMIVQLDKPEVHKIEIKKFGETK